MLERIIKRMCIVMVSVFVVISVSACGRKPASSEADYIGIDAAKAAALKAADISSEDVIFSSAGLDSRNGTFFYQVVFTENGVEHKYDIDALTGIVIAESHAPRTDDTPVDTPVDSNLVQKETTTASPKEASSSQSTSQQIDGTAAWSIAITHAGVLEQDIVVSKVEADVDDGRGIFEVEFITQEGIEYDYEISAVDGSIISFDYDAESVIPPSGLSDSGIMTEKEAKQTVMDRVPGATTDQIYIELDEDDGRLEYEGSLIYDTMKYEFKIDAYSGSVIEWEAELIQ